MMSTPRLGWLFTLLVFAVGSLLPVATADAAFEFDIDSTGFSAAEVAAIDAAAALWEDVILGYQPGISLSSIDVRIRQREIDGVGGVLGSAGPSSIGRQQGFLLATSGNISLDSADVDRLLSRGRLDDVIAHELGHILGIGTLWTGNGLYINGTGQYTGPLALAAYQQEFDATASFVPVELDGSSGTANGHWDELSSVTDSSGRPLSLALMTGFLSGSNFLSKTTIGSLDDLGFDVLGAISDIPGDGNRDGVVDGVDYFVWAAHFEDDPVDDPPGSPENGDYNNDGVVDGLDYLIWSDHFGVGIAPIVSTAYDGVRDIVISDAVPEPSAIMLAVLAALGAGVARPPRSLRD